MTGKMMYRIVGQVAEYRREMAESYIRPDGDYYPSLMADLDEVDLEIERCLNQLMSQYLEYLNTAFASHSRTLRITNSILIVFFMTASLFGMVLNHQMSTSILNSIKRLTDAAREIMNNNLEAADIEETPFMELNQVSATFDQMKRQIRTMITELQETHQMKERLAEAKIRELQMQMNPHFLFNTLSLVIRSIQLGERDTSIQLVKAISKILRSSIEINTVSIPLDAEIELLQSYLYIQKLHLKGRVTFCLDVRKSFMGEDVMIPPLTIQPLVENSIQHGLKDRVSGGRVDILITEKPDYIEVVVADNGVGFPEDREQPETGGLLMNLDQPEAGGRTRESNRPACRETPIPKTSIGLKNVRERLKLFYRKDDVLHIGRTEGVTRITLKLYKSDRH
jgi:sensor histidine kinase YesM